jgi:hypothetical protein
MANISKEERERREVEAKKKPVEVKEPYWKTRGK